MQDLLDEHTEKQKPAPAPPRHIAPAPPAKSPARRSLKRPRYACPHAAEAETDKSQ